MLCGLYETDITPPLETMLPGHFAMRPAEGVRDRLCARALACSNDKGDAFILVALDAIQVDSVMSARARARIEKLTGVPGERVMVSATHTHTGGPVCFSDGEGFDLNYINWTADRAADAAVMAWNRRVPAKLGYGSAQEETLAFNRRYFMKDGRLKTNPGFGRTDIDRPAGPMDPQVGVLKIEAMDGRLIGVITNFACHLDTVKGNLFCIDYPGELHRVLKSVYGEDVVSIFLTGPCGNINHCDFLHRPEAYYSDPKSPHYIRMGRILAGDVLRTLALTETEETEVIAVENASFPALIRTPDEESVEKARALLAELPYKPVISRSSGLTGDTYRLNERSMAASLLSVHEDPEKNVIVPVQTARLGNTAIVGAPCELFVEFGLDIKARSCFENTMISTLTNAHFGYIATHEAHALGGYESQICGSTKMTSQTGYDMVDTALALLDKMK